MAGAITPAGVLADDTVDIAIVGTPDSLAEGGGGIEPAARAALAGLGGDARLLGRRLRAVAYRDACDRVTGEAIAGEVVARGASLVVGHACSASALAAAPVYARHGILMITPAARAPRLTEPRAGATIFRLAGRDDRFGVDAARFIAERFPAAGIAIAHDKSVQGRTLADSVEAELAGLGRKSLLRAAYVAGEREYHVLADQIAASGADLLVVPAQPIEAAIIDARLLAGDRKLVLIGSDALAVPEGEAFAARAGERLIVMLPWHAGALADARASLAARTQAAVEAWIGAVRAAQSFEPKAVAGALAAKPSPTVLGPLAFDARGDAVMPSFLPHVWKENGWQRLTP